VSAEEDISLPEMSKMQVALIDHIPKGAFLDPFQLYDLHVRAYGPKVRTFGPPELEAPRRLQRSVLAVTVPK
jgi:hypothetical protein